MLWQWGGQATLWHTLILSWQHSGRKREIQIQHLLGVCPIGYNWIFRLFLPLQLRRGHTAISSSVSCSNYLKWQGMRGQQVRISGGVRWVYCEKHLLPMILIVLPAHSSLRITGMGSHSEWFLEKINPKPHFYSWLHDDKLSTGRRIWLGKRNTF